MSTTITMMQIPEGADSTAELPNHFELVPLGTHAEVMAILKKLFPDAIDSDPTWILVPSYDYTEIIVGKEDPLYDIGLRNPTVEMILFIYEQTGWRGIDPSNGRIVPPFGDDYY